MTIRKLVAEARYILAQVDANNNKFWNIFRYDDGAVETSWGRVGTRGSTSTLGKPGLAESAAVKLFNSKLKEKEKTGYKILRVVGSGGLTAETSKSTNSRSSAAEQLARDIGAAAGTPVERLVKLLVAQNAHDVALSTGGMMTYSSTDGLFRTPLGIVTADAIAAARDLLNAIAPLVADNKWDDASWPRLLSEYLTLIPRDIGRHRPTPRGIFANGVVSLQTEHQLLDALAGSLQAYEAKQKAESAVLLDPSASAGPRVFDVQLKLVAVGEPEPSDPELISLANTPLASTVGSSGDVFRNIRKLYYETAKKQHASYGLSLRRVYHLRLAPMHAAYTSTGKPLGNVKRLWHGTRVGNVLSIFKTGLQVPPSTSPHVTGRMFGDGIYGSDCATKALQYALGVAPGQGRLGSGAAASGTDEDDAESKTYEPGSYFAFLADYAMGRVHYPTSGFSGRALPAAGTDSTWAKAEMTSLLNDEMIVYKSAQVNPVFLCEFKRPLKA